MCGHKRIALELIDISRSGGSGAKATDHATHTGFPVRRLDESAIRRSVVVLPHPDGRQTDQQACSIASTHVDDGNCGS